MFSLITHRKIYIYRTGPNLALLCLVARDSRVWIHSEMRTWHDQNIHSNEQYRKEVLTSQLNHLAKLVKWLNVRLGTKRLQVESHCHHLNFRFHACFKQRVPWHPRNYRMWIHSEMHTWHDKNIHSNELYR